MFPCKNDNVEVIDLVHRAGLNEYLLMDQS